MNIDLGTQETLYAGVKAAVIEKWNFVERENFSTGDRWLWGVFGDVELELRAHFSGTRPTVRATCGIARYVPKTRELVISLNQRNRDSVGLFLGIADEDAEPGTVRVLGSSSVIYDFITPVSVRQTVETCAWPANIILSQRFLTRFGGELALAVYYRMLADSSAATGIVEDLTKSCLDKAAELETRARAGDVGRFPDEIQALLG